MASGLMPDPRHPAPLAMEDLLRMARLHGETSDTRQWIDNLERMLRVAWDIMNDMQRQAFREHADVVAIAEAAGETPL